MSNNKQQTQNANQTQQQTQTVSDGASKGQVAPLQATRLPYNRVYEERYGITGPMWRALVDAVYPSAKTPEGIILAVSYCQSKGYDVMKKMVHVVPVWSTSQGREVEGVWEAVAALRATAFRTGEYAGCDETKFGPIIKKRFSGEVGKGSYAKHVDMELEFPQWAQVTVYRMVQGVRCAFPGPKVYWLAAYGAQGKSDIPNDKWAEGNEPGQDGDGAGSYMLEKCAEAAALRKAFPEALGSTNAAEEMYGRKVDHAGPTINHEPSPPPPRPTRESVRADQEIARKQAYEQERRFRDTMREEPRNATTQQSGTQERQETSEQTAETQTDQTPHDKETGEVIENNEDPRPDATSATPPGLAESDAHAQVDEAAQGRETVASPSEEYILTAKMLIEKFRKVGTLKAYNAIKSDYEQDIDVLRTEAKTLYDDVMKAMKEKDAWFRR